MYYRITNINSVFDFEKICHCKICSFLFWANDNKRMNDARSCHSYRPHLHLCCRGTASMPE